MPTTSPEQKLMAAILDDAVEVYRHPAVYGRHNRSLLRDTEAWFDSEERSSCFSFQYICDVLDLDAEAIRAALWRERTHRRFVA